MFFKNVFASYLPCNCACCKTSHPHIPSSNTNLTYPISTLADCKSSNLVYQLQCMNCNVFYIGETGKMFSTCLSGHWSTCMFKNSTGTYSHHQHLLVSFFFTFYRLCISVAVCADMSQIGVAPFSPIQPIFLSQ